MFRVNMCPSLGEKTVSMWHLQGAYQTVIHTEWQITKYRIDTVISPDDGHIVVRNM